MNCACSHAPWHHITVNYPNFSMPCQQLICCDQPAKYHDGLDHRPQSCPCTNLQMEQVS